MSRREEDSPKNREDNTKISNASTTSWSKSKDPRIVPASRAFGGKDRHSKVSTVRGLRDRRVRLSVPTAIQLYDLQDRLGFNQPSKVVDWLLNAAKREIDELPPLQIPPGRFIQNYGDHNFESNKQALKIISGGSTVPWNDEVENPRWGKFKNVSEDQRQVVNMENQASAYVSSNNILFSRENLSSPPNLLNNTMPYINSIMRSWDPSNLSLSNPPQTEIQDLRNFTLGSMHFPLQIHAVDSVFNPKKLSFQSPESSNLCLISPLRSSHFSMNPLPSQNNAGNEQTIEDNEIHST